MAIEKSFEVTAHNNVYTGSSRKLKIKFCMPQAGVNESTAILMMVPGYEGNIDSNVYQKMRNNFADQYNMVTIQCDYFGNKYMQGPRAYNISEAVFDKNFNDGEKALIKKRGDALVETLINKNISIEVEASMGETLEEFNDMGFMQAIDIINAIEIVMKLLNKLGMRYNSGRVIGYGHSHGAYLLHLCNILVPDLFSFIIDNSAYIEPIYLTINRCVLYKLNETGAQLNVIFKYIAKDILANKENLNLEWLYRLNQNNAQILTFQGNNDELVDYIEKEKFIKKIEDSKFILIGEDEVDHKKYFSNKHGLNADYLELFAYALLFEKDSYKDICLEGKEYMVNLKNGQIKVKKIDGISKFIFN